MSARFRSGRIVDHRMLPLTYTHAGHKNRSRISSGDLENLPQFPDDFLWGVATAGFQNEGYDDNQPGLKNSDWYAFTTSPAIRRRVAKLTRKVLGREITLQEAGTATNHRDPAVLEEDLERARCLGLNCYRFSLEWSRLQPKKPNADDPTTQQLDQTALDYYDSVIEHLKNLNFSLEPVVTLNHLTLPIWVLDPPRESTILSVLELPTAAADANFAKAKGWETEETVDAFVSFVRKVAEHYADKGVRYWITLNEPVGSMVGVGYVAGIWPPGFSLEGGRAKEAYFNLLRAHVRAYQTIKEVYGEKPVKVGIAHAMLYTKSSGASPVATGAGVGAVIGAAVGLVVGVPIAVLGAAVGAIVGAIAGGAGNIHEAARNQFDYFYNDHILESLISGQIDTEINRRPDKRKNEDARKYFKLSEETEWSPKLDFIGINYYRSVYPYYDQILSLTAGFTGGAFDNDLRTSDRDHLMLNDLGWEICPLGFYGVIQRVLQYKLPNGNPIPILITENGIPQAEDRHRAPFTVAHLQQLLRAMRDGANVLGYIHWTLVDNFEWQEHYTPNARFGLFTREHPDQRRRITEGAFALWQTIVDNKTEGAVRRYGTISPDGQRVVPPEVSPGRMWHCTGWHDFKLFITQGATGKYLGLLFLIAERKWVSLSGLSWKDGSLSFQFNYPSGTLHKLQATSDKDSLIGSWTVAGDEEPHLWAGNRLLLFGVWKKQDKPGSPKRLFDFLAFHSFEEMERWTGKGLLNRTAAEWLILENVHCEGAHVTFSGGAYVYNAEIRGNIMVGSRSLFSSQDNEEGGRREEHTEWTAERLPDSLPF